jgi:transcriptional regulator with XRE-family HTH domain
MQMEIEIQSQSRDWFDSIEVLHADDVKLDFAVSLERALRQSNLTRSDLARLVERSPAWITKILRGDTNLTIETMCRLSEALNHELHLHLAPKDADVKWFEAYSRVKAPNPKKSKAWNETKEFRNGWPIPAAA